MCVRGYIPNVYPFVKMTINMGDFLPGQVKFQQMKEARIKILRKVSDACIEVWK